MAEEPSGSARLEALSDGVIAVVITIIVLEIKGLRANGLQGLRNHLFGIFFYAAGIPVAFFYPRPVLVAIALLTLIWILPDLSLQQARRHSE